MTAPSSKEYLVTRIDHLTGIVVTPDDVRVLGGREQPLSFESLGEAELFCMDRLREHPDSEWWIFEDSTQGHALRRFFDESYWKLRIAGGERRSFWQRLRARLGR